MPELAVITGASAGIGAAFARKLASTGYDLLLVARRGDRLRSLADEMRELFHVRAEVLPADLSNESEINRVAERIASAENLALLVNNAGFGVGGFFSESDVGRQMEMHRLHILATLRLTYAALNNMIPRGSGGVINVASVAGFAVAPGTTGYNSTKAWMIMFTEGLAMELAASGSKVRVQALCPGFTLTEFHDVVKMDRSTIPKSLWLTADFVAEEALKGLNRGKVIVVPGWRYKLMTTALKALPGTLLRNLAMRSARRFRKPRVE